VLHNKSTWHFRNVRADGCLARVRPFMKIFSQWLRLPISTAALSLCWYLVVQQFGSGRFSSPSRSPDLAHCLFSRTSCCRKMSSPLPSLTFKLQQLDIFYTVRQ
jgi:hypothetical protein